MAEDDIYGNKRRYERFKINLERLTLPVKETNDEFRHAKYMCKNPKNLVYFRRLIDRFEVRDLSFIRRLRVLRSLLFITDNITKDLAVCKREDIDILMPEVHRVFKTLKSKETTIKDIKYIWKHMFPEKDVMGREDETIIPYPVRHLRCTFDRSRVKLRTDRMNLEVYQRVIDYFGRDPRMQAYIALATESLGRPQEILYSRIRDLKKYDNYGVVQITEHGKEGPGILQSIDSYPYLLKWIDMHPLKNEPGAFIFINLEGKNKFEQLKPVTVNKYLRQMRNDLKLPMALTCYSLKRSGVTIRRERGESDMEIQHAARWTSTKQLRTYDLTTQYDALERALERRGIKKKSNHEAIQSKQCTFCSKVNGFSDIMCSNCVRPLDRKDIIEEQQKKEGMSDAFIEKLKKDLTEEIMKRMMEPKLTVQNQ